MLHPDAMLVRQEVFVEEQGFHDEFDDIDEIADHYLLYVDGEIAGCCRVFPSKDNEYLDEGCPHIHMEKAFI